ncbi:MAG: hypothetical protein MUF79_12125 [Burkholderiales bacterium]|jgi:hypothetical protein|nr:hypothetical protein [Burkholderiales bacterium]
MGSVSRKPVTAITGAVAALVAGSFAVNPAVAADLGRLFLTPQQRVELDKRRQANAVEAEAVVESTVTLNGQVTRSSGKSTVWINGVPQYDAPEARRSGYRDAETDAAIRPGQTLDRVRGDVRDVVTPGSVRVKPGGTGSNP